MGPPSAALIAVKCAAEERDGCSGVSLVLVASGDGAIASERDGRRRSISVLLFFQLQSLFSFIVSKILSFNFTTNLTSADL